MTPQKVILDCDPGLDDAVSLLLGMASPDELDILAITTVAGNVPLETTTRNACIIRELGGRPDIPVYAGCPRPILQKLVLADEVHGNTGLGDFVPSPPKGGPESQHATDYIIETIRQSDGEIMLVPTGPLTNIAVAMIKAPDIREKIKRIVLMGGAYKRGGNITPSAEFNIFVDPHAAKIVFEGGCPITAIGLDATHQALCTPDRMKMIQSIGTPVSKAVDEMLAFANRFMGDRIPGENGTALHDPCTTAILIAPHLFETHPAFMDVETDSALTRGNTPVDMYGNTGKTPNADWVTKIHADALFELVIERISRL